MPDLFHRHIRTALANPNLQAALDGNADRRLHAREIALASLPEDWLVMRRRAHAVRAQTIAQLDRYLDQFVERLQANGIVVHRATTAAEAVQTVLQIARQNDAHLIAKSKTMVSEEIGLNHALEANGMKVVETDLGEFIIQLRGERPAHIITPAVHLRRGDVSQTFSEKLGLPPTEDIAVMTAAARATLRETFLSAQIGISGVNFGVAETGTLCIVTNEGNGRMVTTIPPVHIALMGIERLVPSLADLALMLALLPRAATGQKLTVYTNLINSPRLPGDPDGALQRHLILVDNGRSAMRASPLSEALLCIRCGACLNACPVFREIGGHAYVDERGESSTYPGPIGSVVSPGMFGQAEFGHLARASSLCGACKEACPVDIDLPRLLLRVRAGGLKIEPERARPKIPTPVAWGLRIYTWFAVNPGRFHLAQRLAAVFGRVLAPRSPWMRMPAFTGWGLSKDMPRPAGRTFHERWAKGEIEGRTAGRPVQSRPAAPAAEKEAEASGSLGEGAESLVERFSVELTTLGGFFNRCEASELPARLADFLEQHGIDSICAWEGDTLPPDLLEGLKSRGIRIGHEMDPTALIGLTGAAAGIAETGTLVLPGGPGRPQTASLLPEVHLAILSEGDIYESLQQALQIREIQESASIALVTGPSRTADIEMTLTIGVHGPREVHVFCVPGT
jgi:L-lactate dehydrogenase complex protein LldF